MDIIKYLDMSVQTQLFVSIVVAIIILYDYIGLIDLGVLTTMSIRQ